MKQQTPRNLSIAARRWNDRSLSRHLLLEANAEIQGASTVSQA